MPLPNLIRSDTFDGELYEEVPERLIRLSHLKKAGLPVTPWFCLTPWSFFTFIHQSNVIHQLRLLFQTASSGSTFDKIARTCSNLIEKASFPREITQAVRKNYHDSIKHSFFTISYLKSYPGQPFILTCPHPLKGDAVLLETIKQAWQATYNEEAIKKNAGQPQKLLIPPYILVQPISIPDWTIRIYSLDPYTNDKKVMRLECVPGLISPVPTMNNLSLAFTFDYQKRVLSPLPTPIPTSATILDRYGHFQTHPLSKLAPPSEQVLRNLCSVARKFRDYEQKPVMLQLHMYKNYPFFFDYQPLYDANQLFSPPAPIPSIKKGTIICQGLGAGFGIITAPVRVLPKLTPQTLGLVKSGEIVVTTKATIELTSVLTKMTGLISEVGGVTSHTALLAREYGIPSIMSAPDITRLVHTGDVITLNGLDGTVSKGGTPPPFRVKKPSLTTTPKTATKILLEVAAQDQLSLVTITHYDGIGLIRGEIIYSSLLVNHSAADLAKDSYAALLYDRLNSLKINMCARTIAYKFFDLPADDRRTLIPENSTPPDSNPFMGLRGLSWHLKYPALIHKELKALKHFRNQDGTTQLHIILPFVRFPYEVRDVKRLMGTIGLHQSDTLKIFASLDTPGSMGMMEDYYRQGLDGIYVNINHLSALLLGLDPENSTINPDYDQKHPACIAQYQSLCEKAALFGLPIYFYGHALNQSAYLLSVLVKSGATGVIVNPQSLEFVKDSIYQAEQERIGRSWL